METLKKKKAAALFSSRRPGASSLDKQSSSAGDPTPLQGPGCMFCGWESDFSLVHTQLISILGPLFQLYLPCSPCIPTLPLPTHTHTWQTTPIHYPSGEEPFGWELCTFFRILLPWVRATRLNTDLQSNANLGPGLISTTTCGRFYPIVWVLGNGGRWQDLRLTGHRSHWISVLLDPFGSSFLFFHLDGAALFLAWGEAWRERAGVEWEVREGW